MNRTQNPNREVHQKVLMALPWYVNGTLEHDEQALVETHLKVCLKCRAELVELQKISSIVRTADDFASEANHSFARLSQRIHGAGNDIEADDTPGVKKAVRGSFGSPKHGKGFRFTAYAQAALVLLGFGFLAFSGFLNFSEQPAGQYRTLSNSSRMIPLTSEGIRVVFAEHVRKNRINRILASLNGEVVSGPNIRGVYVVRLRDGGEGSRDLSKLLEKLRAHNEVIFAEPTLPALSPNHSG